MPPALTHDQVLALAPASFSAAAARGLAGRPRARGPAPEADSDHARGQAALAIVAQILGAALCAP